MTGDEFQLMHSALKREEMIVDNFINIEDLAKLFMDMKDEPDQ